MIFIRLDKLHDFWMLIPPYPTCLMKSPGDFLDILVLGSAAVALW